MKRWLIAFSLVLLSSLAIFLNASRSPSLLEDSDTRGLLHAIGERNAPLSWFASDWPLKNHFYRPVSTLSFEFDLRVHGNNAAGYGQTNALLAALCVLALFWLAREFTDSPLLSAASSLLFASWLLPSSIKEWLHAGCLVLGGLSLLSVLFPGRKFMRGIASLLVWIFVAVEMAGIEELPPRTIGWLPGRTAMVMAVFALCAMAAYARYERTSGRRKSHEPSPFDVPATKSSIQTVGKASLVWPILACVCTALAMASYEQAVMLPTALVIVAIGFALKGYRPHWLWHGAFWGMLLLYLAVRHRFVPNTVSGYQAQQLRSSANVLYSVLDYLFPSFWQLVKALQLSDMGWSVLLVPAFSSAVIYFVANGLAYFKARQHLWLTATGLALSVMTFLPMAWLKQFEHYHFWPMALRAIFDVGLLWTAISVSISAASRPALQAPARLNPAPGSLPHQ